MASHEIRVSGESGKSEVVKATAGKPKMKYRRGGHLKLFRSTG